jgi:hypothetical protein
MEGQAQQAAQGAGKAIDAIVSKCPPKGATPAERDAYYTGADLYLRACQAEMPPCWPYRGGNIEDDYFWIRTGC